MIFFIQNACYILTSKAQATYEVCHINIFLYNKCGHGNVLSKRQVWMSVFHIINFKKKIMDTGSWIFFNKKLIMDYYFRLESSPVFLFQIENLN